MTPFGQYIRNIRKDRGISLKKMATDLRVSSAYLSALENGNKGAPSRRFQHQVCQYLSIIWDEATYLSELARLSDPKPKTDVSGLSASHFELGNRLAAHVPNLSEQEARDLLEQLFPDRQTDKVDKA